MNMSCFLVSISSLSADAEARNKTFLDIIRGRSKNKLPPSPESADVLQTLDKVNK